MNSHYGRGNQGPWWHEVLEMAQIAKPRLETCSILLVEGFWASGVQRIPRDPVSCCFRGGPISR